MAAACLPSKPKQAHGVEHTSCCQLVREGRAHVIVVRALAQEPQYLLTAPLFTMSMGVLTSMMPTKTSAKPARHPEVRDG